VYGNGLFFRPALRKLAHSDSLGEGTTQMDADSDIYSQESAPVCRKCGGRTTFAARVPDLARGGEHAFYRCELCRLTTSTHTRTRRTDAATSSAAW
jgi:hypothetical protein